MNLRLLEMPDLMVKHAHLSVALRIRAAKPHRAIELVMKDGLLREVNWMILNALAEERELKAVDGVDPPGTRNVCLDGRMTLDSEDLRLEAVETDVEAADSRVMDGRNRWLPVRRELLD